LRDEVRPESTVAETLKLNGNWKALFVGPNTKIRRELTPLLAPHFAAFVGRDLESYPTIGQLAEAFRGQELNLCFLDTMSDRNAALGVIQDILRVKPGIPIIAVMADNDPDLILRCLRQGTSEFLLQPFTNEQVEASLRKLAKLQPATEAGTNRGKVFCVMPAKGGSGATTIACNLAYQWKRLGAKRILLADLDQLAGTMSFILKLKSNYSFVDVIQRASDIDADLWKSVATARNGVDVLLSPEAMIAGISDMTNAAPILEYARAVYDVLIVDAGSVYGDWNLSQAQLCDELLLVATNELTSLQAVQRSLGYLDANNIGRWKIRIIVNRYDKHVGLSRESIGTALHTDIYHVMPSDYDAVQRALIDGKPIPPGTTLGKSIVGLADRLAGREAPAKKSGSLGGLLSLFSRTSS
jgi:pilus assembly protein CpaE